jgi:hypothetical protein
MKTIKFWDNISAIIFLIGALIFGTQCFFQQSFTLSNGLQGATNDIKKQVV